MTWIERLYVGKRERILLAEWKTEQSLNEKETRTTRNKNGSPEGIELKQQTFAFDDLFDFFLSVPGFHIRF